MKTGAVVANLLFTAVGAFGAWCAATDDPANVVEFVSAHPWTFKALVVYVIVDAVVMVWFLDWAKAVVSAGMRRDREDGPDVSL